MNKTNAEIWREVFATWPAQFRRKGVVLPSYGEPIPFVDFVMNSDLLIVERPTPDNVGARRIAVPLQFIEGLKYTEPLKTEQFLKSGFTKGITQKPAIPQQPATAAIDVPTAAHQQFASEPQLQQQTSAQQFELAQQHQQFAHQAQQRQVAPEAQHFAT